MSVMNCLEDARDSVRASDEFQNSDSEIRHLRSALRAVIQAVDELNDRLDGIAETHRLWDGS